MNRPLASDNMASRNFGEAPALPHNLEAEQALLGALMAHPDAWAQIGVTVRPEHFFEPVHARIFDAAATLNRQGRTVSPLILKSYFEQDNTLQDIGGWEYLVRLTTVAVTPSHSADLARIVGDLGDRRNVIAMAGELADAANDVRPDEPIGSTVAKAVTALSSIVHSASGERRTTYTLEEAGVDLIDRMAAMWQGLPDRDAIPTGLAAVDGLCGGLHRGEYTVLGGRPSMGKTALGIQVGMNVAERGGGVFYASLEMPCRSLMQRIISARVYTPERPISYSRIGRGQFDENEFRWLTSATQEIQSWPLVIDDGPGRSAPEIEALARVAKAKMEANGKSLDLVVVDHLHKMRHAGAGSKVQELTEISAGLAEMAKRLHVPVLALAQLNRSVESRDDKRPTQADLRESGSIEQDADAVLFVYRPAYYLERQRCRSVEDEADRIAELEEIVGTLEVIVAKQRNGPIGTAELWCDMASNIIRDPASEQELRA